MLHPRIDLNLIRVFVTIYKTKSVTAAADRLCLTQPTVRYELSKLRTLLNNPLFIRTHDGMAPTVCGDRTYEQRSTAMAHRKTV
jgi:DNA-binding transcriptional LysR family regulator